MPAQAAQPLHVAPRGHAPQHPATQDHAPQGTRAENPGALPATVERLFAEHHDRVFRAAFRITGNATDAEDVLQTIFLRLLRRSEPPDLAPSPGAYLHRAAINAALDIVRQRGQQRVVALEQQPEMPAPAADRPDRLQHGSEIRDVLRAAVARLSPRAAEMFTLRYFEGHDPAAIAAILGTSKGVVAVTLFRTRSRLKKELASFAAGDLS